MSFLRWGYGQEKLCNKYFELTTGAIVQAVGQTKGAIGYIGLAYETKEVKQLAVSYDQGKLLLSHL
jgi:ABC-type phosphate transport system substrate-binding protein